jgi:hypothetical protein
MGSKWKKFFFWSSLGSLAFSAAVMVARKPRKKSASPLVCRPIPPDCGEVLIWTERFQEGGAPPEGAVMRDKYVLQPTRFRLWSVLDLGAHASRPTSTPIYYVSLFRMSDRPGDTAADETETLIERFYGTVLVRDLAGKLRRSNCLARGGILELDKCYVGGTSNGVLAGETHLSLGPVLNYQFRYLGGKA